MAVVRQCSACVSCVASCGLRAGSLLLQWRLRLRTAVFLFVALWRRSRSRCPVHRPWTRRRSATRQRCLLARAWWMPSVMTLCALPWPQAVPNRADACRAAACGERHHARGFQLLVLILFSCMATSVYHHASACIAASLSGAPCCGSEFPWHSRGGAVLPSGLR